MKKSKKLFLILLLFSFSLGTTTVFAEDDESEKTEEEIPVNEEDDGGSLDNNDERVENEDQNKRDKEIIKTPIETPASVTGEKYNGSGTVVDFTTTGSKAFYTVKGADNSVYYIIIDLDKTEDNVYFLNEVNGEELSVNDVANGSNEVNTDNEPEEPEEPKEPVKEEPTESAKPTSKKKTNWTLWIVLIGAIALFGYEFLFGKLKNVKLSDLKKKKKKNDNNKNDEDKKNEKEELEQEKKIYGDNGFVSTEDEDEEDES